MQSDFEFIKYVVDKSDMSDDDKTFIKTSLWASEEVPEITTAEQYEAYSKLEAELRRGLPDSSSPEFDQAFIEWSRSREGILATSYGAKMVEWENQQEGSGPDKDHAG